jgi:hypothetical protein
MEAAFYSAERVTLAGSSAPALAAAASAVHRTDRRGRHATRLVLDIVHGRQAVDADPEQQRPSVDVQQVPEALAVFLDVRAPGTDAEEARPGGKPA